MNIFRTIELSTPSTSTLSFVSLLLCFQFFHFYSSHSVTHSNRLHVNANLGLHSFWRQQANLLALLWLVGWCLNKCLCVPWHNVQGSAGCFEELLIYSMTQFLIMVGAIWPQPYCTLDNINWAIQTIEEIWCRQSLFGHVSRTENAGLHSGNDLSGLLVSYHIVRC